MVRIWVMFVCLKRRHYNKAPLVWLSSITNWGLSFKELYNVFQKWPSIFDEYPIENTHSIFRAQTQATDNADDLERKAKVIFESKSRQSNFRTIFTPPRKFFFSQRQLVYLKTQCAKFLTKVIKKIRNNLGAAKFKDMNKGKRNVKFIILPDLLGEDPAKCEVLPLGYQGQGETKPDENSRCDIANCKITNKEVQWKRFDGCWHSFHLTCIKEASFCPLCKVFLENKAKELGQIAKEAIFNISQSSSTCADCNDDENDSEDLDNTLPDFATLNQEDIDETITQLNNDISSLPSAPPPSQTNSNPQQEQQQSNQQSTRNTPQQPNRNTVSIITSSFRGTTEWLLPLSLCQSQIMASQIGSNACTIISVLSCLKFLSHMFNLPNSGQDLTKPITEFSQTMKIGNMLYNTLTLPVNTPNLEVKDVLSLFQGISLRLVEDTGFFTSDDMLHYFQQLLTTCQRKAGVLIIPPGKSMSILFDRGKVSLMDSHRHGRNGGVIATCASGIILDFVDYIKNMSTQNWNASLNGCNFALLEAV